MARRTKQAIPAAERQLYCSAQDALKIASGMGINVTLPTILSWIERHKLGVQPGGNNSRWFVHRERFTAYLTSQGA